MRTTPTVPQKMNLMAMGPGLQIVAVAFPFFYSIGTKIIIQSFALLLGENENQCKRQIEYK